MSLGSNSGGARFWLIVNGAGHDCTPANAGIEVNDVAKTFKLTGPGTLMRVDRATGTLRSREYHLTVVTGPDSGKSAALESRTVIGTSATAGLALTDDAVSSEHLELVPLPEGVRVRDLSSTNGTFIQGARITDALLEAESTLKIGRTLLRVAFFDEDLGLPEGPPNLAGAIGTSRAMRRLFGIISRVAPTKSPVGFLPRRSPLSKSKSCRRLQPRPTCARLS